MRNRINSIFIGRPTLYAIFLGILSGIVAFPILLILIASSAGFVEAITGRGSSTNLQVNATLLLSCIIIPVVVGAAYLKMLRREPKRAGRLGILVWAFLTLISAGIVSSASLLAGPDDATSQRAEVSSAGEANLVGSDLGQGPTEELQVAQLPTRATSTPADTPEPTYTLQPTYTPRPTYTVQPTYTPLPTSTPVPTGTIFLTNTPSSSPTTPATRTPLPTATLTPFPTATSLPPTATVPPPTATSTGRETARVTSVVDGDTIEVDLNGAIWSVRYIGIDTPESNETCGPQATQANAALVAGQTVTLVKDVSETDPFGRLLRYVYVGNTFVNGELVAQGWADAIDYPPDTRMSGTLAGLVAQGVGRGCDFVAQPLATMTLPPPVAAPGENCTPGYSPCIPPGPDVDCAGGSGNGPRYIQGPVQVDQAYGDPYDLDRDGDGIGCEG